MTRGNIAGDPGAMMKTVEVFWSHQSPYCYFVLDRILALRSKAHMDVVLRLVLPGLIRNPDIFRHASPTEERYFARDVARTASFLGLPYGEARPYPVEMEPGTLFRAVLDQPRVPRLYHLTAAATEQGKGWEFLDQVTRLIWDGTQGDWHLGDHLRRAIERAGLDYEAVDRSARKRAAVFDRGFAENHRSLLEAGHWGVPTFVFEREPFFGQDRFDQLIWKMGLQDGVK
jgi:2-hydroxychromene-2-carboxylate isomerase